jgi:hypothetical protein
MSKFIPQIKYEHLYTGTYIWEWKPSIGLALAPASFHFLIRPPKSGIQRTRRRREIASKEEREGGREIDARHMPV